MTDFSYQLYSSRNFGPLAETLKMVRDLGYAQVEGYGDLFRNDQTLAVLRGQLLDLELTMPTAHIGLDQIEEAPGRVVELAQTLGIKEVFVPFTAHQDLDAAGWRAFGARLVTAAAPLRDAGLGFGWHNHAFEFAELDGEDRPLDLILAAGPEIQLELDVAWAVVAGQDPIEWIERYADRLAAVHLKDLAPEGTATAEDGWADLGHGTMDWSSIMGAVEQSSARYFVMEHDNPSDDARFARRALAAARAL